jgi:hypothetical protein
MRYRIAGLLALLFCAASAQAQFITDPARATAARDTILHEALLLRQRAEQTTRVFATNARGHSRKQVVVSGTVDPTLVATAPASAQAQAQAQAVPPRIKWMHFTRYRRNGRVQERFRIWLNGNILLDERRLNGAVLWLSIPAQYRDAMGLRMRHRGLYLRMGYLLYDKEVYVLPPPLQ